MDLKSLGDDVARMRAKRVSEADIKNFVARTLMSKLTLDEKVKIVEQLEDETLKNAGFVVGQTIVTSSLNLRDPSVLLAKRMKKNPTKFDFELATLCYSVMELETRGHRNTFVRSEAETVIKTALIGIASIPLFILGFFIGCAVGLAVTHSAAIFIFGLAGGFGLCGLVYSQAVDDVEKAKADLAGPVKSDKAYAE